MTSITYSNIFDAVTNDSVKASELQLRSDLLIVIRDMIDGKGWQEKEAAKHMDLTQQGMCDLDNGYIEPFTISILINCMYHLGYRLKPEYDNGRLNISVEIVQ